MCLPLGPAFFVHLNKGIVLFQQLVCLEYKSFKNAQKQVTHVVFFVSSQGIKALDLNLIYLISTWQKHIEFFEEYPYFDYSFVFLVVVSWFRILPKVVLST